jgi:hypothetical protein
MPAELGFRNTPESPGQVAKIAQGSVFPQTTRRSSRSAKKNWLEPMVWLEPVDRAAVALLLRER